MVSLVTPYRLGATVYASFNFRFLSQILLQYNLG